MRYWKQISVGALILVGVVLGVRSSGPREGSSDSPQADAAGIARQHLEEALRLEPDNPETYSYLSEIYEREGRTDELEGLYAGALKQGIDTWWVRLALGKILVGSGRPEEALPHLELALQLNPRANEAWHFLTQALTDLGQRERALRELERGVASQPDLALPRSILGRLYLEQGRTADAMHQLQAALELAPQFEPARLLLARALISLAHEAASEARSAEALQALEKAVAVTDGNPAIVQEVALSAAELLDTTGVQDLKDVLVSHLRARMDAEPDDVSSYWPLADLYMVFGDWEEAIGTHRTVLELRPNAAEAHFRLGKALEQSQELEAAARSYRDAIRLEPSFEPAYRELGRLLESSGDLRAARELYESAQEALPARAWMHLGLARVYMQEKTST